MTDIVDPSFLRVVLLLRHALKRKPSWPFQNDNACHPFANDQHARGGLSMSQARSAEGTRLFEKGTADLDTTGQELSPSHEKAAITNMVRCGASARSPCGPVRADSVWTWRSLARVDYFVPGSSSLLGLRWLSSRHHRSPPCDWFLHCLATLTFLS